MRPDSKTWRPAELGLPVKVNRESDKLTPEVAKNYVTGEKARAAFFSQAVAESLVPIRPGVPGKAPFWNSYAPQFKYAPAFDFKSLAGASHYRFTAITVADKKEYVFEAPEPWTSLTPIWKELPVGAVVLKVEGLDREGGAVLGPCGQPRKFWRSAVFHGPYLEPARSYLESARMSLRYLFGHKAVQIWKDGCPDPADPVRLISCYGLYRYPSKMISQVITCAIMRAELNKGNKDGDEALRVLNHASGYLMRISEPGDAPLAYFPPTYRGKPEDTYNHPGQIMMIYPATVADAYLDVYEMNRDERFLEAARHIADTYSRTQLPDGTWPLLMDMKSGKGSAALLIPTFLIRFFDRLGRLLGNDAYGKMRTAALAWVMENPLRTFDWQGQFEDMPTLLGTPYRNQTKYGPVELAIYLLEHKDEHGSCQGQAEELLRFAEDQFVVWEQPFPPTGKSTDWITPCVIEQYTGYYPIDASAACMITAYQRACLATGNLIYLAKATALTNAMTMAQDARTGYFPTYWAKNVGEWWINCAMISTRAMFEFARMTSENR